MLTSTSAVHCLRKLEKLSGVPHDLKMNADVIARVLKMRVTERADAVNDAAITAFIQYLGSLDLVRDVS